MSKQDFIIPETITVSSKWIPIMKAIEAMEKKDVDIFRDLFYHSFSYYRDQVFCKKFKKLTILIKKFHKEK